MHQAVLDVVGVTVTGLSLGDVDASTAACLRHLLAEHGVLIMPGQQADDTGFIAFLKQFGALAFTPGETPVDGFADLNLITNVGRRTPPRSVFHIDTSYVRHPPAYTALRAVTIPARGGETLFTNQYRAYATLPDEIRTALAGRTIRHVLTGLEPGDGAETAAEHPVFRPHPISGRTSLYVSTPERCVSISGISDAIAPDAIAFLYEHSTAPANTYRHAWAPGDVVMWDNGCVLHRADHADVAGDRVMHRGMVAGYRARRRPLVALRTLGVLGLLLLALPLNLALTAVALLRSAFTAAPRPAPAQQKTVMVSGGKMTKALQLARSFHAAGHRVILIESARYRFTGHRFSRAVDRFHVVPKPQAPGYAEALLAIVRQEHVDVYVPVCSPVASYYDALAKPLLEPYCEVVHGDADMVAALDDKYEFATLAASLGLTVPDAHRIRDPGQVEDFDFSAARPPYILKSIPYDPVHRLDLTTLPRPSRQETGAFARSKPISADTPWIMQGLVRGREYCTHATVRGGQVQVYCCCESSAFQVNYEMADKPEIEAWVRGFVQPLKLTGQVSFDFIQADDGRVYAIECNPRTHSAITMFYNHPGLARAYLEDDVPVIEPQPSSRPTYWIYHEVWRLLTDPAHARSRLKVIRRGKDAIFDWADPLPFLMVHHLQIPWLLAGNLIRLKDWIRIDFNIGKLVEPSGD